MSKYVIIGNGIAGWEAAEQIRNRDKEGKITIISDENHPYYSRPGLMYPVMDDFAIEHLYMKTWYDYKSKNYDFIFGWAPPGGIDPDNKKIELHSGKTVEYDKLLLATGAAPRKGGWENESARGVVNFTVIEHANELYSLIPGTTEAVVVGAGLIGIELVEILHHHKIKCHLIIRRDGFYQKGISLDQAKLVHKRLEEYGVEIHTRDELERIDLDSSERVSRAVLKSGKKIPCQIIASSIGVVPRTEILKNTGIEYGKGIKVNERLQTNHPDVYAAGDCAWIHFPDKEKPVNELLWYTAKPQGRIAGRNMAGEENAYVPDMFFNSASFMYLYYLAAGEQWPNGDVKEETVETKAGIRRLMYQKDKLKGYVGVGPDDMLEEVRCFIKNEADVKQVAKYFKKKKPRRLRTGL